MTPNEITQLGENIVSSFEILEKDNYAAGLQTQFEVLLGLSRILNKEILTIGDELIKQAKA
jgi:hypothetical protein